MSFVKFLLSATGRVKLIDCSRAFLFSALLCYPSSADAAVTDQEAAILNAAFGKTFTASTWNAPLTLHLASLPHDPFPRDFDAIPHLVSVDFLHSETERASCIDTDVQSKDTLALIHAFIKSQRERFFRETPHELKEPKLCLNGEEYALTESISLAGHAEGAVYGITAVSSRQKFALKIYYTPAPQAGDILALKKARKSEPLLCMPLVVNIKYHYTIFPLLPTPIPRSGADAIMSDVDHQLRPLLKADGLALGDNLNTGNYMKDAHGKLKRIDFGALRELH